MPTHEIEIAVILRTLDDETHIAEALFFPEVSRYGDNPERLKSALVKNAARILKEGSLPRVYSHTLASEIETFELHLHLDPPLKHAAWREPLDLRLDVLYWRHGESAHIAFIPALGIEVISPRRDDLVPTHEAQTFRLDSGLVPPPERTSPQSKGGFSSAPSSILEGRLTDGRGRVADFTNSIVVKTSNLGAERFRHSRAGFHNEDETARAAPGK
jgi:hypothetical protein